MTLSYALFPLENAWGSKGDSSPGTKGALFLLEQLVPCF